MQIQENTSRIVRKPSASIPVIQADVCVVGSGSAGIMAALQSARLGNRVVLADASPLPGGQSTNAGIGLFCGLYSKTNPHYRYTYGIVDDLLKELGEQGALHYRDSGVTAFILYDEQALLRWIDNHVRREGVITITGACIDRVHRQDRRIEAVDFLSRFGRIRVEAQGYVDATGDAALTYEAGLPCRESGEGPIFGTQILVADNIDRSKLPPDLEIRAKIREDGIHHGLERRDGLTFYFPNRNRLILNMTHVETPLDPIGFTDASMTGRDRADTAYAFLKQAYPEAFQNASVHSYGQLGIRQTRWICGAHTLSAQEVRDGIRFPDAIGRTTWPIELHNRLDAHLWEVFDNDHTHYIPLGAMLPAEADNLAAAGRCIDADLIALSSVRVMGPCMAMGMAAAHTLDLAGNGSVHDIDISALQTRLRDNLEREDIFKGGNT